MKKLARQLKPAATRTKLSTLRITITGLVLLSLLLSRGWLPMPPVGAESPLESEWDRTFGGASPDYAYSMQLTQDGGYIVVGCTLSYGAGSSDVWLVKTDSSGNKQWDKTFGGSEGDCGYSVQQTLDGGYIIAGSTSSYGAGGVDVWLVKTDSSGNKQWDKTFGGTHWDHGYSVRQTLDGGFIIGGDTDLYEGDVADFWLIKTDASGNKQWDKVFGGHGYDFSRSVQQTADGGYVIAGITGTYGAGFDDAWLIKTDSLGNKQWDRTFGGASYDRAYSVQQTQDGGYVIAGHTSSYGTGVCDFWLIKTDYSGNKQWDKTFGGSDNDYGHSVQQTTDGGYVIAGITYSYGAGGTDVWLVKTDSSGNKQGDETFGGSDIDRGFSVQQTADGGYVIVGDTRSYGAGAEDFWIIKTMPGSVPPAVATNAATNLSKTSATLNGNLTSLGTASSANVSFEWGLTTSYGTETVPQTMIGTSPFSTNISGLTPGTTYHFMAKAIGDGPPALGLDMTFTTELAGPNEWVGVGNSAGTYICKDTEEKESYQGIPLGFVFQEDLVEGMRNTEVKYLQILLNSNPVTQLVLWGDGCPSGETDNFGPKTRAAVEKFQESYGIPKSGEVTNATRVELNKLLEILEHKPIKHVPNGWVLRRIADEYGNPIERSLDNEGIRWFYKVEDVTDGTMGWVERGDLIQGGDEVKTRIVIFENDSEIDPDFIFSETALIYGTEDSTETKYLQVILKHGGVFPANVGITGNYFDETKEAVRRFQERYELDNRDGLVGNQTVEKLNEILEEKCTLSESRGSVIRQEVIEHRGGFELDDFPLELILAIAALETEEFDNEMVACTPCGRGIMQIDRPESYVGSGSGIRCYKNGEIDYCGRDTCGGCCGSSKAQLYEWKCETDCKCHYTNTMQGIEANIRDGLYVLSRFYSTTQTHYELCTEGEEGWDKCKEYGISCDEMRWISTVQRYNGYNEGVPSRYLAQYGKDKSGNTVLVNGIAYHLKHLRERFGCDNNDDLANRIEALVKDEKVIGAVIFSPGELRVYDSQGRVTGLVSGEIKEGIPLSFYDGEYNSVVILLSSDSYIYEVAGTEQGSYGFELKYVEGEKAVTFTAIDIATTSGAVHKYSIDWDALSQGEEGVTVDVDSDGDGITDYTVRGGNVITGDEFIPPSSRCFIATATYGTPIATEIQAFRAFRDQYLLTNPLGQSFVDVYYKISPPIAWFITEHPTLKPIVRAGLLPAVAMSTVVFDTTMGEKIAILGLLVFVAIAVAMRVIRRRGRDSE